MFSYSFPPILLIAAAAEILRRSSSLLRSLQPSQGVDDIIRIKPVRIIDIDMRQPNGCRSIRNVPGTGNYLLPLAPLASSRAWPN